MASETVRAAIELPVGAVVVHAAPPDLVSQKTSEAVLGIPRRMFLESLPSYRAAGNDVASLGKLRLVGREAYVAWLRRPGDARDATENDGVAVLAAKLGLRVLPGRER